MKQFVGAAVMAVAVEGTQQCLYCRRQDQRAGFLVSYSYCEKDDYCLKDAWNYINKGCDGGWRQGSQYELSFCKPEDHECPTYVATREDHQEYKNSTWSLAEGEQCTVTIDATESVGRVIFANT